MFGPRQLLDDGIDPIKHRQSAEARDATLQAMKEAERGWQRATAKIAELAGLTKGPDGTWRDPSMSEAA
jgi:hypothetical protein